MALKSYKPTTPSQRNLVIVDRTGLYRGKPVKSLVEGSFDRRTQQPWPYHQPLPRRRPQAGLSHHRLQAGATRRGRNRRAHRIRSEPHRLHRAGEVQGRRADLHPGATAPGSRRLHRRGRAGRHQARQRHAARQHAGRHHRAQRRAQGRQGRADRAFGRHLRPDRRPRWAGSSGKGPSPADCSSKRWSSQRWLSSLHSANVVGVVSHSGPNSQRTPAGSAHGVPAVGVFSGQELRAGVAVVRAVGGRQTGRPAGRSEQRHGGVDGRNEGGAESRAADAAVHGSEQSSRDCAVG